MKYSVDTGHYCDFNRYAENKENARSYFIPHSSAEELKNTNFMNERYESSRIIMLSGKWDFKYYEKVSEMPSKLDTDDVKFDTINVPSTWQRTGYENPWYINSRYQFKLDPPRIPKDIPVGVYRKTLHLDDLDSLFILNFLGVCSCFDLFVNGQYVGYSEGSHNTAEFNITKYLNLGDNEILLTVYKWCNGTYLECQDMFRENGIFRDCYIIREKSIFIRDFHFITKYMGRGKYSLRVKYHLIGAKENVSVAFKIQKDGETLVEDVLSYGEYKEKYDGLTPLEWTAETPNVYEVTSSLMVGGKEITAFRTYIGFKHIEIKGNIFYFNDKKIKLKGINHHETHPKNGYTVTLEELEKDVKLIKAYNCNTVRLSHYPHDPVFLTLCDIYGLYAIDEMDLECHGVYSNPLNANRRLISDNLKWEGHFLDRAKRMFYRDRVHPSVTMWSLGNEAGGDACQDKCNAFFKNKTDIPVHYENAIHGKRFAYSVIGEFYPAFKHLQEIADGTIKDKRYLEKPYFMSEYAHSMGVGPGGLETYMKYVLHNDNFLGGCIWEFCDHAVYDEKAQYKYTYGGDHGEKKHDKNFCVDGMFFPDRTPSTGALTMRECYRPIRAERISDSKYLITNTNRFVDTSDIDILWQICRNGEIVKSGRFDVVVPPDSSVEVKIDKYKFDGDFDYTFDIFYEKSGKYVAREQFNLKVAKSSAKTPYDKPEYERNGDMVTVKFKTGGKMVFNLSTGEMMSYKPYDVELVNQNPLSHHMGFLPNMYRAPIDNEMFIKIAWNILGLLKAEPRHYRTTLADENGRLTFYSKYYIMGYGVIAVAKIALTVGSDGRLGVRATLYSGAKLIAYNEITRFGVTFEMPKRFENVEWYGLGERETFPDFMSHGFLGKYKTTVSNMHEKYIKPQESGNRSGIRYFTVTDKVGNGIKVSFTKTHLNFNANHYTRYQLSEAKHIEDLKDMETVNVQIDGFQRGVGSNSCGPLPQKDAVINLKEPLDYWFVLEPLKPEDK